MTNNPVGGYNQPEVGLRTRGKAKYGQRRARALNGHNAIQSLLPTQNCISVQRIIHGLRSAGCGVETQKNVGTTQERNTRAGMRAGWSNSPDDGETRIPRGTSRRKAIYAWDKCAWAAGTRRQERKTEKRKENPLNPKEKKKEKKREDRPYNIII